MKSEVFSDKLVYEKNLKSFEDYIILKVEQNWEELQGIICNNDLNVFVIFVFLWENFGGKDFVVITDIVVNFGEKVNKDM